MPNPSRQPRNFGRNPAPPPCLSRTRPLAPQRPGPPAPAALTPHAPGALPRPLSTADGTFSSPRQPSLSTPLLSAASSSPLWFTLLRSSPRLPIASANYFSPTLQTSNPKRSPSQPPPLFSSSLRVRRASVVRPSWISPRIRGSVVRLFIPSRTEPKRMSGRIIHPAARREKESMGRKTVRVWPKPNPDRVVSVKPCRASS